MRAVMVALVALAVVAVGEHEGPVPRCMDSLPPDCEADDLITTCEMRAPPNCRH